ncbi:MAG: TCP-1/cpn60 chaperonin family protein [Candidatus Bathyarchaeia archaeon]
MVIKNENLMHIKRNVVAATLLSDVLKTMLGPCGSQKIVAYKDFFLITGDVKDIIETVDIDHPIVNLVVKDIGHYKEYVGDGTIRAVLLMSRLLERAVNLIDQGLHPNIIADGYQFAIQKAKNILTSVAKPAIPSDLNILKQVIKTSIDSKTCEANFLADLMAAAIKPVIEKKNEEVVDNVKFRKKAVGSLTESELYRGAIIKAKGARFEMPRNIKNAKVALFMCPLKTHKTRMDIEIISTPKKLKDITEGEKKLAASIADKIEALGVNLVFCYEDIADSILDHFVNLGIMAYSRTAYSDIMAISKVTGAKLVYDVFDLSVNDLGMTTQVIEKKEGSDHYVYIDGSENSRFSTIVLKGNKHIINNAEKALSQAIKVVSALSKDERVVAGGGATFIEIAIQLQKYSKNIESKEALAVKAFSNALEDVVSILVANAGVDPFNIISELKRRHYNGDSTVGILLPYVRLEEMFEIGVIEPLHIFEESLKLASSLAITLLNIDNVIHIKTSNAKEISEKQAEMEFSKRIKQAEEAGEDWIKKLYRLQEVASKCATT